MMRDSCQLIVSRNFGADIDNSKVPLVPPCKEGPSKGPHPAKFPLVYVDILIFTLPNLAGSRTVVSNNKEFY